VVLGSDGQPVTSEHADELAAAANELAVSEGATSRAMTAIREAVHAARVVLSAAGSRENRRRLSETLWRQAAALATVGQAEAAAGPAREAIDLARQAVRETRPDDPALDAVCGEFGRRVNDLSQILGAAGHRTEAQRLVTESADVTRRSDGPLSARARAGTMQIMVSGLVDEVARSMADSRPPPADQAFVIAAAESLVGDLRRIASEDDPTTVFDLGQGLHVLGRACAILAQYERAVGALAESHAIFARFDGAAARSRAEQVRAELDQVARVAPRAGAPGPGGSAVGGQRRWWRRNKAADPPQGPPAAMPEARTAEGEPVAASPGSRAASGEPGVAGPRSPQQPGSVTATALPVLSVPRFTRAREVIGPDAVARGGSPDEAESADAEERLLLTGSDAAHGDPLARAADAVARRRRLADLEPVTHGPLLGFATALHAHLLCAHGRFGEAASVGDQAVLALMRYSDDAARIQPSMVLALDAVTVARIATGGFEQAERALRRALDVLRRLADRDHRWLDDLAAHETLLSPASAEQVFGLPLTTADDGLAEGRRLSLAGRLAEAETVLETAMAQFAMLSSDEDDTSVWNLAVQRRLALAHWRYVGVVNLAGRPQEALSAGRRGIGAGLRLLGRLKRGTPEHSEVTAETVTAMTDLAEIACRAGLAGEGLELLDEAVGLSGGDTHPAVRRALGTALHNKATNMLNVMAAAAARGTPLPFALESVDAAITRALTIRADLAGTDALARWELANSLLLHSRVRVLGQRPGESVESLNRAVTLARQLGPAAADLLAQARALATMLQEVAPGEVRQARARGGWPF